MTITENLNWIDIEEAPMPIGPFILAATPYGIEFINFHNAAWRYCYTGAPIAAATLAIITHWAIPKGPKQ